MQLPLPKGSEHPEGESLCNLERGVGACSFVLLLALGTGSAVTLERGTFVLISRLADGCGLTVLGCEPVAVPLM